MAELMRYKHDDSADATEVAQQEPNNEESTLSA